MASDCLLQTDIDVQHTSESVYKGLCLILGAQEEVAMRRDTMDLIHMVEKLRGSNIQFCFESCGSRREGFRFKGSDTDVMLWSKDHKVIWDMEQAQNYKRDKHTLILSDCSDSPPGYTQLVLITQTNMESVYFSCISRNDRLFISSSALRKTTLSGLFPGFTEHGPCSSGIISDMDVDSVHCLASDTWPPLAFPWIAKSQAWPGFKIVNEIVKCGCHVVPIGHKLGNHELEEWRISFALAEQKLVYSMNHCQFLTYGLLKLLLKEVINDGLCPDDQVLSSYHMKTAVFWVLQQNTIRDWCPQNLLEGFWVCFKFILKCVYVGVCPNFFIPENNMFLTKIQGKAQNDLFLRLYVFFEKGLKSLLCSLSISPYIHLQYNSSQFFCTDEQMLIHKMKPSGLTVYDLGLCTLLCNDNLPHCMQTLQILEQLIISRPMTQYQVVLLQKMVTTVFQSTAFLLHNQYSHKSRNKLKYTADKMSRYMLKLVVRFGSVSERLFLSMYFYRTRRYLEALSNLEMTKVKLHQICVKDMHEQFKEKEIVASELEKRIWIDKRKTVEAGQINLEKGICYIRELYLEQQYSLNSLEDINIMFIPAILLMHMLEFLSYSQIDPVHVKAQSALQELESLVFEDQRESPSVIEGDISWQILGICQQMSGKYKSAFCSYLLSMEQDPVSKFKTASLIRQLPIIRKAISDLFGLTKQYNR